MSMKMNGLDPAEKYLAHLQSENRLSAHTQLAYARDLKRLAEYLDAAGIAWRELRAEKARAYAAKLHQSGLSGRSIRRMLSAARGFYRHFLRAGEIDANPFDNLRAPKSPQKLPGALGVDELNDLLADAGKKSGGNDPLELRDRAMLELFYSSGLRLAELAALDIGGVDFAQSEVRVTGKGGKQRVVPVGEKAKEVLQAWLKRRGEFVNENETAMFIGKSGARLGMRAIQQRLNRWAQRRGLGRRLHPHMLRHSFASHVLASSGDLRAVQEMLGHSSIAATQVYTHLDFQQLAKVYDKAHPRAKKK
ncbi:MAG: site-specific tyrosine recombinase [Arenicellales bacterium IbO2]|nr:tyrosine recombinase XerC [Gammaproteobacteria bacterium]MDA7961823.1 tyrosine recombinase XerC [Gammaproteobacteria bacterium]CAJ2376425.1 MAG: site-specific tyrosine recombinase [Arenicellales bacterium IbO2]